MNSNASKFLQSIRSFGFLRNIASRNYLNYFDGSLPFGYCTSWVICVILSILFLVDPSVIGCQMVSIHNTFHRQGCLLPKYQLFHHILHLESTKEISKEVFHKKYF